MKESQKKETRWREYFIEPLNNDLSELPVPEWTGHEVEERVDYLSIEETTGAINSLKNWKSPGSDEIPKELLKYGGEVPLITSYVKSQRVQWFGHGMRKTETTSMRAGIEWGPMRKKPRGRPKWWVGGIREELEKRKVTDWKI